MLNLKTAEGRCVCCGEEMPHGGHVCHACSLGTKEMAAERIGTALENSMEALDTALGMQSGSKLWDLLSGLRNDLGLARLWLAILENRGGASAQEKKELLQI